MSKRWRGLGALIKDAVHHASQAIERVHKRTADRPFGVLKQIPPIAEPVRTIHTIHDAALASVHAAIRLANSAVGTTIQTLIDATERRVPMTPLSEEQILEIVRAAHTVAVYGMQDESRANAPAHTIPAALKRRGYQIFPVNPNIESALGEKAWATLAELPVKADILDVFRRSEFIPALADEIIALPPNRRPRTVWLQSGIAHEDAEQRLQEAGFQVVSDRCLAVYAARVQHT